MRSVSLILVVWLFCRPLMAANSYGAQMRRLRQELQELRKDILNHQAEEAVLLEKHRMAIADLRDLEESLRRKEERIQNLQHELSHYERAQRQAILETDRFQLKDNVERLRELLSEARSELHNDENNILKQRQVAVEIVTDIQRVRSEISSLSVRAKASDLQSALVGRRLRGL